jgi:tetratricopeptide (TPR) repeat protein
MPDEEDSSFKSGMMAFTDKSYHEAIDYFTRSIQEKSDIHKAFNALGVTYSKTGNLVEAEQCFQKALVLDPHNPTYEKNLGKIIRKKLETSKTASRVSPSPRNSHTGLLVTAISLVAVTAVIFLLMFSLVPLQSGESLSGEGTRESGIIQPLLQSLMGGESIPPEPLVMVQNKKIEYLFDRHQDLSQVQRIEASIAIPDGTRVEFPVVTSPQKTLYYGIDDPFLGKEKEFVMTGYFQDGTSAVLIETVLDPR